MNKPITLTLRLAAAIVAPLILVTCVAMSDSGVSGAGQTRSIEPAEFAQAPVPGPGQARAIFAGGCFWCMEPPFDALDGVVATTSGYIGGKVPNPTYEIVASDRSGHREAVEVIYEPARVSYEKLLEVFWVNIDPTVGDRQFCDIGSAYRAGIFTVDEEQRTLAEASREALDKSNRLPEPVVTDIKPATTFYPAEEVHQNFYQKNPLRYKYYRAGCRRDARLKALWGDPKQFLPTTEAPKTVVRTSSP